MDELLEKLISQIDDENNGVEEYSNLINEVKKQTSLSTDITSMVVNILNKIKYDEESHKQLLMIIKDVISE